MIDLQTFYAVFFNLWSYSNTWHLKVNHKNQKEELLKVGSEMMSEQQSSLAHL